MAPDCGRRNCDICNILEPGNEFESTVTGKVYIINFHFHCNSECVVYLLTFKICRKQYLGSTIKISGYVLTNTNPILSCMEKEEGTLNWKSRLNIFVVKIIAVLTKTLMLK